jgi:putative transposase
MSSVPTSSRKAKQEVEPIMMDLVFRFAIEPSPEQEKRLFYLFYLCRNLYNIALEQRIRHYKETGKCLSYYDQQKQLPSFKVEHPEYRHVPSQSLQDVLRRLDQAYVSFFEKRAGFPRIKDKFRFRSITIPQCEAKRNFGTAGFIYIPKIGRIRMHAHQDFDPASVKIINVKHHNGKWHVNLTVEASIQAPQADLKRAVGVDMGLHDLAVTSDGAHHDNPRWVHQSEKRLKKLQRKLSKKKKGSQNHNRAKMKLQYLHDRITNQRKDFLHKLSYRLMQAYDLVCIEDLSVQEMMKNHQLAKSIANSSWYRLANYLDYKSLRYGKRLVKFSPENTTQDCSGCGRYVWKSLSERAHHCPGCGLTLDRDENAARNILKRGLKQIA